MKNKPLCSLFLLMFMGTLLNAQPTLVSSGINPVIGEQYTIHKSSYVNPGSGGGSQFWNLSAMTSTGVSSQTVGSVASTTYGPLFPGANLQIKTGPDYGFYTANTSALTWRGSIGTVTLTLSDPEDFLQYPFNMLDGYSDPFAGIFVTSSSTFTRTGTVSAVYDGFGTVATPSGTFQNVARVHMVEDYTDVSSSFSYSVSVDSYYWYANGFHLPLASVSDLSHSVIGNIQFASYLTATPLVTTFIGEKNASLMNVFPNPASDVIRIVNSGQGTITKIQLFDLKGVMRHSEEPGNTGSETILDVKDFSVGIYLLKLYAADGSVETRKISVLH